MSITLSKSTHIELEQKLLLPRIYSWQEFEVLENLLATGGFRITYLDGWIELMTVGEPHDEIPEVWLWENNQLQVYAFISSEYHLVPRSQLLPDLDLDLLVRCVQMPSRLEAMRAFRHGLHHE